MKRFLIILLVVLVAVGIAVSVGLNTIVTTAINNTAPKILGVEAGVEGVELSLFSGEGRIKGLYVKNPAGFSDAKLTSVGDARIKVDISSIYKNPIIINEIIITEPAITYEIGRKGSNVDALISGISKNSKASESNVNKKPEAKAEGDAKKVIIERLEVNGAIVSVASNGLPVNASKGLTLPNIQLNDLGKDNNQNIAEIAAIVFAEIRVVLVKQVQENLSKEGLDKLRNKASDSLQDAGGKLKGLLSR